MDTEEDKSTTVNSIFGMHLNIESAVFKKTLEESKAEESIEIRLIIDGVTKDFTLDEFKQKLGF